MESTCYYAVLGLEPTANREEISQAFHKLALKNHPLRNDPRQVAHYIHHFSRICEAFEVLENAKTKNVYDTYGMEGLRSGVAKGPDACEGYSFSGQPYKVFERVFSSANPFVCDLNEEDRAPTELQKIDAAHRKKDVEVTVMCTLHEFYCGVFKEVHYKSLKANASADSY